MATKADQEGEPEAKGGEVLTMFGIYFCSRCRNMMTPHRSEDRKLIFKCQTCGLKEVQFKDRKGDSCLLFSKDMKTLRKKYIPEHAYIFDPSMPTVEVECPECGHNRAIYFLVPDEQETKMLARMMCKNVKGTTVKCGHIWDLNDESELSELKVKVKCLEEEEQDIDLA